MPRAPSQALALAHGRFRECDPHYGGGVKTPGHRLVEMIHVPGQKPLAKQS